MGEGEGPTEFPKHRVVRTPEEVQSLQNKERAERERLELEKVTFTEEDRDHIIQILARAIPRDGTEVSMKNRLLNANTPTDLQRALGRVTEFEIIDTPDFARAVALACEQLIELKKALRKPGEH